MAEATDRHNEPAPAAAPAPVSPWAALHFRVFRWLWLATVVNNVGGWMYNAASGWLMTSLNPDPFVVSLVQVANSLPLFLFALPAGALADMIDKRRFILLLEILTTVFCTLFALLVAWNRVTPAALLIFIALIGTLGAIETPAWQAITPLLVPKPALSSAIALNSLGVNISRVVGPALTGVMILTAGIAAPFWVNAVSNLGVILVILAWRVRAQHARVLPPEHLTGAMRAGLRYARHHGPLRAALLRAVGFFLPASAYWALLPVLARTQLNGGAALYGVLLGVLGAGAVGGALVLPRLKERLGADGLVVLGELGTAAALVLFALAHAAPLALLACVLGGASWILVLATLNVAAQLSLPEWVRGRGLAVYATVFFGTMSLGSALWGLLGTHLGLVPAHLGAAAAALLAIPLTRRWRLQGGTEPDLAPCAHWPAPVLAQPVESDAGPVLVSVEYHVEPKDRAAFLAALTRLARTRRRDGAYRWGVFEDTAHPGRFLETFLVDSWLEHLRQHERVTRADRALEDRVRAFTREAPRVTHYISAAN
ncbi:MAG TPA: MFS transporter [Steroidobacteraceae bacterium]|nr:MFS transporter [Steroidobacteraceae bacterium]